MRYIHSEETLPIPENGKLRFLSFGFDGCVCEGEVRSTVRMLGRKDDIRDDEEYGVIIEFAN